MDTTRRNRLPLTARGSLRLRLTAAVVLIVLAVTGAGMFLDYSREYRVHMGRLRASLTEQAEALRMARKRIDGPAGFAGYVEEFCAQMNEGTSPGHHVMVLDAAGRIIASARRHSGREVEKALLAAEDENAIRTVNGHRIAQVRLTDADGATIILAQYLDRVEGILRRQLVSRAATAAATALAIIALLFLALHFWSIRPVERLAEIAGRWSSRVFSARADPTGPSEIRLLAGKFNAMAEELERHEHERAAEMERAKEIQENLLPTALPPLRGLRVAWEYRPVGRVAGDLYDVFELPSDRVALVILDVAGHGISAALLTGVVKMSLHRRLAERRDLAHAIGLVNGDLLGCVCDGQFVTACAGVWDPQDRTWTYCAAGHAGGLLRAGGHIRHLPPTGPLLGVMARAEWSSRTLRLRRSSRLFLYTDGVTDAGSPNDGLGRAGLEKIVRQSPRASLEDQVALIMAEALSRTSGRPQDDATVLAIELSPEG